MAPEVFPIAILQGSVCEGRVMLGSSDKSIKPVSNKSFTFRFLYLY